MSKRKVLSFTMAFVLVMQIFTLSFSTATQAAVKNGLQKVSGKTYYYKNGKMVKNKWVTVKKSSYYFGKNGAAYKGYKKVGKNRYYFDTACRMVSDKVVKINGKKYYFIYDGKAPKRAAMVKGKIWKTSSGGRLVKNINSLAKEGKDVNAFLKAAGKPLKQVSAPSCRIPGQAGTDCTYTYDNFMVISYQYNGSNKIVDLIVTTA